MVHYNPLIQSCSYLNMDITVVDVYQDAGQWTFRHQNQDISLAGGIDEIIDLALDGEIRHSGIFLVGSTSRIVYDSRTQMGLRLYWLELRYIRSSALYMYYKDSDPDNQEYQLPKELVLRIANYSKKIPRRLYIGIYSTTSLIHRGIPGYEEDQDDFALIEGLN